MANVGPSFDGKKIASLELSMYFLKNSKQTMPNSSTTSGCCFLLLTSCINVCGIVCRNKNTNMRNCIFSPALNVSKSSFKPTQMFLHASLVLFLSLYSSTYLSDTSGRSSTKLIMSSASISSTQSREIKKTTKLFVTVLSYSTAGELKNSAPEHAQKLIEVARTIDHPDHVKTNLLQCSARLRHGQMLVPGQWVGSRRIRAVLSSASYEKSHASECTATHLGEIQCPGFTQTGKHPDRVNAAKCRNMKGLFKKWLTSHVSSFNQTVQ